MKKIIGTILIILVLQGCKDVEPNEDSNLLIELTKISEEQKINIEDLRSEMIEGAIAQEEKITKLTDEYENSKIDIVKLKAKIDTLKDEVAIMNIILTTQVDLAQVRHNLYNKGISNDMMNLLGNLGMGFDDMLNLTDEEIARIFAPGTHLDGYGFDMSLLSEEKQEILESKGIDFHNAAILSNLGYSEEDMLNLSEGEIDFVLPNTELIQNLNDLGKTKTMIDNELNSGLSYRDIIKEALYE